MTRVLPVLVVGAGSAAAFIGLAFLIYWVYFTIGDSVYDRGADRGSGVLYGLFYTAFAVHMFGSVTAAVALKNWTAAPAYTTLALVTIIFGVFGLFTLGALTGANLDRYSIEFPLPGQGYR